MNTITLADWIGVAQSGILIITIAVMLYQLRQSAKQHREDLASIMKTHRSEVHTNVVSNLLALNRIMLEYPEDVKGGFEDLAEATVSQIRQRCYVYAVLDLLNHLLLHQDVVDPFIAKHLQQLAMLLKAEPSLRAVFEEVKDHQSEQLVGYLEDLWQEFGHATGMKAPENSLE